MTENIYDDQELQPGLRRRCKQGICIVVVLRQCPNPTRQIEDSPVISSASERDTEWGDQYRIETRVSIVVACAIS